MHSVRSRSGSSPSALSPEQHSALRADLEMELRRLFPDEAGEAGMDEVSLRDLAPRVRGRVMQIVAVLRRMESDTFGVCVSCESFIGYERLAAIPETTVCAYCSQSRELVLQG